MKRSANVVILLVATLALTHAVFSDGEKLSGRGMHLRRGGSPTSMGGIPGLRDEFRSEYGDLTCMKLTGGTCRLSPCKSERGATCVDGYCTCESGSCASSRGKCEVGQRGKWIGSYAIRFLDARSAYLTIEDGIFVSDLPATNENPLPQWKVAHMPDGLVRLESTLRPGRVLTIGIKGRAKQTLIKKFKDVKPDEASFQVREVIGKGLELYHPASTWSVAGYEHGPSSNDVTHCLHPESVLADFSQCMRFVAFQPRLPSGVVSMGDRAELYPISLLHTWQKVLFAICIGVPLTAYVCFLVYVCALSHGFLR